MQSQERVFDACGGTEADGRSGSFTKLEVTGHEVGMQVRQEARPVHRLKALDAHRWLICR
jgi:hypothetical protein